MKIGILGGTFDPIHKGHLHLAEQAQKKLGLDRVFFIPAYLPPHKEDKKDLITPARYRYAMVKRALKGNKVFGVLDIELKKKRKVYTIETLQELQGLFPEGTSFFLITGGDNAEILDQWKDLRGIFKLCRFVIATRPGFKPRKLPREILFLPIQPKRVSSTDLRRCIASGKKMNDLLPSGIAEFIRNKKLYRRKVSS